MATMTMTMLGPRRLLLAPRQQLFRSSVAFPRFNSTAAPSPPPPPPSTSPRQQDESVLATYDGPMTRIFGRLKLFSLASLSLSTCASPLLLFGGADVPMATRLGLIALAMSTSGVSTAMVAWIAKPYVAQMLLVAPGSGSVTASPTLEMRTTSWRLRPLQTTIYEPSLIRATSRPFATWELPAALPPPPAHIEEELERTGASVTKLLAETRDMKTGKTVGRYWATWDKDEAASAKGQEGKQCAQEGNVVRHFNVQEDLLGEDWQVL